MGSGQFSSIGSGTSTPSSTKFGIWSALTARTEILCMGSSLGPLTDVWISTLHGFTFQRSPPPPGVLPQITSETADDYECDKSRSEGMYGRWRYS